MTKSLFRLVIRAILTFKAPYIEGAIFQIKMTPNQIIMTAYEEDPFLIFFLRFDSNSLIRIKSGNLGQVTTLSFKSFGVVTSSVNEPS
jgi:hypothetical protein